MGDCKALIQIDGELKSLKAGESSEKNLKAFAPWRKDSKSAVVKVQTPGLEVEPGELTLPGTIKVTAPADTVPGNYYLKVTGNCLPFKRWMEVKK